MIAEPTSLPESVKIIVYIISTVGFPIAIAGWFIFKLNGKLTALVEAMVKVTTIQDALEEVTGEFAQVRLHIQELNTAIKEAHSTAKEVAADIKREIIRLADK